MFVFFFEELSISVEIKSKLEPLCEVKRKEGCSPETAPCMCRITVELPALTRLPAREVKFFGRRLRKQGARAIVEITRASGRAVIWERRAALEFYDEGGMEKRKRQDSPSLGLFWFVRVMRQSVRNHWIKRVSRLGLGSSFSGGGEVLLFLGFMM